MIFFLKAFKNIFLIKGRASRSEYWFFILFAAITIGLIGLVSLAVPENSNAAIILGGLAGLYVMVLIVVHFTLLIRRLHDTGRSGIWVLVNFIPLIGSLVLIIFALEKSQSTDNKYGTNQRNK
ncbi:DUF805 domain-containing protein [Candidatus Nomurabacteria bacterium]|nr:DUF805 domain-containing protein [Candidatus Nomurabacteria bacterium]